MPESLATLLQYLYPKRLLTKFAGLLAFCKIVWVKNLLIRYFIKKYNVNMIEALSDNLNDYPHFNSFFTRRLKPLARPFSTSPYDIISPADGLVSQIGTIQNDQLFQAKNYYFTLDNLFAKQSDLSVFFQNGLYATFYLAPKDYHRVHMPINATLLKTIFIPGKLFSVSISTANHIPELFSRNERLICFFETEYGKMAVILVGAMLVGSINTILQQTPHLHKRITSNTLKTPIFLKKGDELGYFNLGSTVILLFSPKMLRWHEINSHSCIKIGETIGIINL